MGPIDRGLAKLETKDGEGDFSAEKRWGNSGDATRGGFGMPWVESGRLLAAVALGTASVDMIARLSESASGGRWCI